MVCRWPLPKAFLKTLLQEAVDLFINYLAEKIGHVRGQPAHTQQEQGPLNYKPSERPIKKKNI